MITISPSHRLILQYNINPVHYGSYYRYVLGEFVPALQQLNLHMIYAWQVFSNHLPERQVEFVCEGEHIIRHALKSDRFLRAERRLKTYTTAYRRKVVHFENRCQV
ncbi:MAG: hypothetical protein ACOCXZ_00485 [Chloroflexota bacterium]